MRFASFSTILLAVAVILPGAEAAGYKPGTRLNSFFRVSSAPAVTFLEKHGIRISDLAEIAELEGQHEKEIRPLLASLKPADFPYIFFYTNETLLGRKFPGYFGVKIDSSAWMALVRAGAEKNPEARKKIRNRFYVLPREDMVLELLPDGILMLPAEEAADLPELKSLEELQNAITKDMGISPASDAVAEYHEKSAFASTNERIRALLGKRSGENGISAQQFAMFEKIFERVLKNPFLRAVLGTRQTALRFDLKDGITLSSEYVLGNPSHKEAFVKSMTAMQVLGSVALTAGMAAWEAQGSSRPGSARTRLGLDLLNKFAESFERIRIAEREDRITLTWQFVNGEDIIPAMQQAKKIIEERKAERKTREKVEAVRDELCAALTEKDKEKIRTRAGTYAEMLPTDEYKVWRIRQICANGTGLLLSVLEYGNEDTFLKLVQKLKYHAGGAPTTTGNGRGYLHIALERRFDKALKQILDDGMTVNHPDHKGKTPLIYAIERKDAKALRIMLEKGVKIISEADTTLAKKTLKAAEASADEKIIELVNTYYRRENAVLKKHATQS